MTHTFQLIPPPGVFHLQTADTDFWVKVHYTIGKWTRKYYLHSIELSPIAMTLLKEPLELMEAVREALRNHHDSNVINETTVALCD
jgi:hypothetical protein